MIRNQMDSSANAFLSEGPRRIPSSLDDFPSAEERAAELRLAASIIRRFAAALNHLADALSDESVGVAARRDS